jgi:hypothetical protein
MTWLIRVAGQVFHVATTAADHNAMANRLRNHGHTFEEEQHV